MGGFPCSEIELNEVNLNALSLHGQGIPPIALLGVGVDEMDEVPGGVEGEEASSRSPVADRFCRNTMTFPSSTSEILKSGVQSFLLKVCFLEEHDRVTLAPHPVLDLFAEEGDIAEGDMQRLLAGSGFLGKVFCHFDGCVGDQLVRGSRYQPDLRDLFALLKAKVGQRSGIGPVVSQPVDVVNGQYSLVVSIFMRCSLMEDEPW